MTTTVDKYFSYDHLPADLQEVSKACADLHDLMDKILPDGAEKVGRDAEAPGG